LSVVDFDTGVPICGADDDTVPPHHDCCPVALANRLERREA
jgi:hypothetical protein